MRSLLKVIKLVQEVEDRIKAVYIVIAAAGERNFAEFTVRRPS